MMNRDELRKQWNEIRRIRMQQYVIIGEIQFKKYVLDRKISFLESLLFYRPYYPTNDTAPITHVENRPTVSDIKAKEDSK